MKILVGTDKGSYSFNKTAKTVSITGIDSLTSLEQVLLVTDVTASGTITGNLFSGSGQDITKTVPTGCIIMAGFSTEPTKSDGSTKRYLLCNGQAVSRSTYSALFSAVSTTFGAGDGSSTFNVPDMLGRMPIGAGAGSGLTSRTLGAKVGAENLASGSNVASGSNYSYAITNPATGVNFFIATEK